MIRRQVGVVRNLGKGCTLKLRDQSFSAVQPEIRHSLGRDDDRSYVIQAFREPWPWSPAAMLEDIG